MKFLVPSFACGAIKAECVKYSLGGGPIVVVEADSASGDDAEVVLDMVEASGLHEWLGQVLARVAP